MKTAFRHKSNHLHGDLEKIKEAIFNATRDARHKASDMMSESLENAKLKSSVLQNNVREYVNEKPLKSLGIAVLTGIVLGYLLRK